MAGGETESKRYLECGRIINTRGVNGKVKLESWCDSPEVLASVGTLYLRRSDGGFTARKVGAASVFKKFVICSIEGVNDHDSAEALKGATVYARREDIPVPEGGFFIADLIGLPVYDASTGKVYGKVREVFNAGASDIYTVETPDGERMIPAVDEFVRSVDLEKGIAVSPIEGMFD
ncbi:MAG: 16S rRNA processing protein RimM [Clostridia bacterium]|nr:16S rRNA processing protein RimM [Clostridia bacterium]